MMNAHRQGSMITRLAAGLLFVAGVMLMVFMMVTESEPGALPLLMVITGAIWSWRARVVR